LKRVAGSNGLPVQVRSAAYRTPAVPRIPSLGFLPQHFFCATMFRKYIAILLFYAR